MAVYAIGSVLSVKDHEKFGAYQQAAGPTLAMYGGKVIAGGYNIEVADGNATIRTDHILFATLQISAAAHHHLARDEAF